MNTIPYYLRGEWERLERKSKRRGALCVAIIAAQVWLLAAYFNQGMDLLATRTLAAKQAVEIKLQAERIRQLECDSQYQQKLLNVAYPGARMAWVCEELTAR